MPLVRAWIWRLRQKACSLALAKVRDRLGGGACVAASQRDARSRGESARRAWGNLGRCPKAMGTSQHRRGVGQALDLRDRLQATTWGPAAIRHSSIPDLGNERLNCHIWHVYGHAILGSLTPNPGANTGRSVQPLPPVPDEV